LNPIVEGILASAFSVPVRIERVVSEPLSQLTVTRLESVRARAEGRLHFKADSISVFYDPIDLLAGRLQSVVLARPDVFLNLDAPLADVARIPEAPGSTGATGDGRVLPVTAGSLIVDGGDLALRIAGRDLRLSDLSLQVWRLGEPGGQEVALSVNALGGRVRAHGILDVVEGPGGQRRHAIRSMEASAKGISAASLAAWAFGRGLEPDGTLDVQCSLEGTWPEKVDVVLTTRASGLATGPAGGASLTQADLGLRIEATIFGDLERIVFAASSRGAAAVAVGAREIAQAAAAEASGEYRRLGDGGAVLEIRPSKVLLDGTGEVRVQGTVRSFAGDRPPHAALAVEVPSIDLREAAARIPRHIAPPGLLAAVLEGGLEGRAGAMLRIHGDLDRPETTGCFEVRELVLSALGADLPPLAARGTFDDIRIDLRGGEVDAGRLAIAMEGFPAGAAARALGLAGWSANGELGGAAELAEACLPVERSRPRARVDLAWTSGALEREAGFAGATGISASAGVEAVLVPAERAVEVGLEAAVRLDEVLLGPFYARLAGSAAAAGARGILRWSPGGGLDGVSIERLHVETPLTGRATASGSISRGPRGLAVDGTAGLAAIPLHRAFPAFVRDPFAASFPFLHGSSMDGEGSIDLRVEGTLSAPRIAGRLAIGRASAALGATRVEGLGAEIPFELGAPPGGTRLAAPGWLRAGRIASGPIDIRGLEVPLRLARGAYSLASPLRIEALGGVIDVQDASFSPSPLRGPVARATIRAGGLDAGRITRGWGLPEIEGSVEIDLHPIALTRRDRLDARGVIALHAFGGSLAFADLIAENLGQPYFDLHLGRGHIEGVRLGEVGRTFRFGVMSGVLHGTVKDLRILGGEVSSFEADVETVRTGGVPQYLNRQAIESIRRVLTGPFGAIEETLFSRFRYDRFGFWCRLQNGIFRLRGKYEKGGVEYVMYSRWYQFPRIDIVNGRPDMPYDWRSILANLRAVYAAGARKGR
jgi:hypothetical protein